MSTEGTVPPALTEEALRRLVLDAIAKQSDIDNPETFHALWGHLERGIQTDDVLFALKNTWNRFKVLPFNKRFWQWKYKVWANNADDEELLIILAVDSANREFEVITRWPTDDNEDV